MGRQADKNRAARRAAKKHQKDVARRRAKAARNHAPPRVWSPEGNWLPKRDGLEGLARNMDTSFTLAANYAEYLHEGQGRADAALAWLPSRMRALGVEGVVAGLAARGVVTDREGFRSLAAEHLSTRRLVDAVWLPKLAARAKVHDRDFLRGAADFLWMEWSVELISDEQAELALDGAETHLGGEEDDTLERLLRVWEAFAPGDAARRLDRAGLAMPFVRIAGMTLRDDRGRNELDAESLRVLRQALVAIGSIPALDEETSWWHTDALDDIDWSLGDGDAVITRLLARYAERAEVIDLFDAACLVLDHERSTEAQIIRVREALVAALPTILAEYREEAASFLADLEEAPDITHAPP